ncbi:MAG: hypothetical protein ACJ73D_12440, partial [Pyrinomonadaceae bacterium]
MTWLDLTIIYLACGAPFAVYRIVLSEHAPKKTAIRSTRAGLLWPFVGAKAVLKRLRSASRSLGRPKLESIRREMETALAAENPHLNTFEFREVFERYTTLATALRSRTALPATTALWNAIGSGSPATSVACVARA